MKHSRHDLELLAFLLEVVEDKQGRGEIVHHGGLRVFVQRNAVLGKRIFEHTEMEGGAARHTTDTHVDVGLGLAENQKVGDAQLTRHGNEVSKAVRFPFLAFKGCVNTLSSWFMHSVDLPVNALRCAAA